MELSQVESQRSGLLQVLILVIMVFLAVISLVSYRQNPGFTIPVLSVLALGACLHVIAKERSLKKQHVRLLRSLVEREGQVMALDLELQAEQIRLFHEAWAAAGHEREPRVSVSRSIFALVDDRDRAYFGRGNQGSDQVGYIDAETKAIFGRSYAAEPDVLAKELAGDTAIQAADTLLLTVPNQLGVEYNTHAIESILRYVAPELGWR